MEIPTFTYSQKPETLTEAFDNKIRGLVNEERQADYGHPLDHFVIASRIKTALQTCPDPALRHALEVIADKMARLCHNPEHFDSWIDIAGYARTAVMIMDERKKLVREAEL